MQEVWKPVLGYEDKFLVSNLGRIYQKEHLDKRGHKIKGKIRSTKTKTHKYESFSPDEGKSRLYVHRAVAMAFCCNDNKYNEVNHVDGNKRNNKAENLEWCTSRQNKEHAYRTGLHKTKPLSEELKERISKTVKALWDSGVYDDKKKVEYTSEYRKRLSEAHKGLPSYTIKVRCVETGEVFNSAIEASLAKCGTRYSVKSYFSGKQKLAGGYNWERLNEKAYTRSK